MVPLLSIGSFHDFVRGIVACLDCAFDETIFDVWPVDVIFAGWPDSETFGVLQGHRLFFGVVDSG